MPYFVVYALDRSDGAAIRAQYRPSHRARLRDPGIDGLTVHVGGPLNSEEGAMIGSMLVIEAADKATVNSFVQGDPYTKAGLYDSIRITPFQWGLGAPKEAQYG